MKLRLFKIRCYFLPAMMVLAACSSGSNSSPATNPGKTAKPQTAQPVIGLVNPVPERESPTARPAPAPNVVPAGVAVAAFEGGSIPADKRTEFWGKALQSFMIADLGASRNLRVVDRAHLAEVLREQRLSATALADPSTRMQVGRIVGAKYFVFGTYTIVAGQAAVTARMDSVESGLIVEADSVSGNEHDLRALSQQLAGKFLQPLDQVVAAQEVNNQSVNGSRPADAVSYFQSGLSAEQAGRYEQAIDLFTQALALSPHYQQARDQLEKASELAARSE